MRIYIGLALLVCMGIVGNQDYRQELKQQSQYCEMVKQGLWPAYNEQINCKGK